MHKTLCLALVAWLIAFAARADEGMWTYHDFPTGLVQQKYGVQITPAWLDKVRLSTVRLSNCTASFVSGEGLILTNHHCAASCLAQNSSKDQSLLENGYLARKREQELRCPTQVADVLVGMEDVTAHVAQATANLDEKAANEARKRTLTQLEQSCEEASRKSGSGPLQCESVDLYKGGQYYLYKYKRYDDVRLVFAPEDGIAAFGGDPDNFQFPRWCLDMSLLRAYDASGKPARTPMHFAIDRAGPKAGDLVFVSGHPGSTERLLTVSELLFARDVQLPQWLLRASELRGRYIQFSKASTEAARITQDNLSSLENAIKVNRKLLDALHDDALLERKRKEEATLRKGDTAHDPWSDIERVEQAERNIALPYTFLERGAGFNSQLFRYARTLARGAEERAKPNTDRLREFRDSALPRVEQQLKAGVPVYPDLEQVTLSFSLERLREWLGPDHPIVRKLLSNDSPDTLAARTIAGSKLADPKVRVQLWQGGKDALGAAHDPMIELAQAVDAEARAIRKRYEDEVEAPLQAAEEKIAKVRFAALGTSVYPDATFTLRLNFGTVQGWTENGTPVQPFTHLDKLYDRATGQAPFAVPQRWQQEKSRLDPNTPFNFATNNDIVGGNSGSPLIDTRGRIVGLMFDGNIHSISGGYWFDTEKNRAIAVHPAIMTTALEKVYGAKELVKELGVK